MKQDADWQDVSDSYDPLELLKLIENFILKQSDNQYKIGIVIEQLKLLLAYRQDDGITNAVYYDWFKIRVDVVEHISVSFDNPVLWDWKSQELYSTNYELLLDTVKEAKVKEYVKQAFWVYLFLSIAMTGSTVSLRRLWQTIMQRAMQKRTPAAAIDLSSLLGYKF
jgi:hypothetical protein